MMSSIRKSSSLVVLALLIVCAFSCKSKKKAMEASSAKAQTEQEAALKKQQQEEEEAKRREAEEKAEREKREAEARMHESASASAPSAKLSEYFLAIANAGSVTAANNTINEALTLFASPDTPVLIVISEDKEGQKDYDRPTTIRDYLNYLKDQKKNMNKVSNLKIDNDGKITEVELKKPL